MCNWSEVRLKQGREEGKQEVVLKMLKKFMPLELIEEITDLRKEEIQQISKMMQPVSNA